MAISSATTNLLGALLPEWHLLLQEWSASGRLTAAAQEALLLDGEPQALQDLVSQWSLGDFQAVPGIVLLSNGDINGALGAYAQSTGKIYLNANWLNTATQEAINAVLTEELGHHLDGLLNATDTLGDEGEAFSNILFNRKINQQVGGSTDRALPNLQEDTGYATINGQQVAVEFASTARSISTDSSQINSLGVNGQGLQSYFGNPYTYSYQIIVGTAATGEYLATPFDISLAEKYTTPAGFDVWTIWKDAGKTKYISLIALKIEEISFSGTYVSNNGGPSGAIPRLLTHYPQWGYRGGGSDEIFLGESSFYSVYRKSIFVVAGGDGTDNLFIPLVNANNLKLQRNSLGLSQIIYIDTNGGISQYITTGIEYVDYIDKRHALTNPSNYNLVNGTARAKSYPDGSYSVYEASSESFNGTRTAVSTIGTIGNDLILAGTIDDNSFYLSFDGQGGSDVLLFGNFTRANLGNATQLSPSQWRLTFGGLVITANNIEYLQLQDMAVRLNADGTTTDVAWQDDVVPNDNTPNITLAVSPASVLENGVSNLIYTFTRTGPTTNALTVNYGIAGTADNSDYTGATPGTGKTITFAANSATATLTIDPTADTTIESDETVALTLATRTGYTVGTTAAVVGTISNDDSTLPSMYALTPSSSSIDEGSTLTTTVATTNVASGTNLYWSIAGTGVTAADFSSGSLTGSGVVGTDGKFSFSHTIANDNTTEGGESFEIKLFVDVGRTNQVGTTAKITINDTSKAALSASFGYSLISKNFQNGGLLYGLLPNSLQVQGLSFINAKLDLSQISGLYVTASQIFAKSDGTYSTAPSFSNDGIGSGGWGGSLRWGFEAIDNFVLGSGFGSGLRKSIDLTSLNTAVKYGFPSAAPTALAIQIYKATQNVDFSYSPPFKLTDVTAVEIQKRANSLLGTVIISLGTNANDSALLLGKIINNGVSISGYGANASDFFLNSLKLPATNSELLTVKDTSGTPTITLAVAPASVAEDGTTNLVYTFTRTGVTTNALTVNYGITGTADNSDYIAATPGTGKTITFAANSATAILTIDPTADNTVESDETVALTLQAGSDYAIGTTAAVVGTISNDDSTTTTLKVKDSAGKEVAGVSSDSKTSTLSLLTSTVPLKAESSKLLERYRVNDPILGTSKQASAGDTMYIDFTIKTGALKSLTAEIALDKEVKANAYVKVNPNTGEAFDFTYDPITGLGAQLLDNNKNGFVDTLKIYLQDGAKGDVDGLVNGEIRNPGVLADAPRQSVYRFFKASKGVHFYTSSDAERANVNANPEWGYKDEGVAYDALVTQGKALHRFFNAKASYHFMTTNDEEAKTVKDNPGWGYSYEGQSFNVSTVPQLGMSTPVNRFYRVLDGVGQHFYTASADEASNINANPAWGYKSEGVGWYV